MNVYVWGTGRLVGKVVGIYIQLDEIEAFVDNDSSKKEYMGKSVICPQELLKRDYDAVLVINLYREEIYKQCEELGISLKKVIFLYNNCKMQDVNDNYDLAEKVLGKKYTQIIKNRYHIVRGVEANGEPELLLKSDNYSQTDYVRIECFKLAAKEILKRNIQGAVAEVGVFRGEFAQYINAAFPERKCYLFDTFGGFDKKEALQELEKKNCTDSFIEAYKQTNIGMVVQRMPYFDNVVIKQGYFPESLEGLEEKFAFVSLDMDFEDSIYEGLKYFYPRLEKGGYIFVHDYNSSLRGVENAVDRYEADEKVLLAKTPLCDANGTLVITKG